ncbi:MAG: GlsB/YeaQ/YmgE family stress response membrane protein, partial [Acidobacteriota bacterium]
TIIVGLIVGVLARFLLPGSENLPGGAIGILITIVVGIIGAFIGSFIGQALGFAPRDGNASYAAGWIMSIIGAVLLLLLVRLLFGRRGTTTV